MANAFSCRRTVIYVGAILLLAGGLLAMCLHMSETSPVEPFQPWVGNPEIQLEAPAEEIESQRNVILAKEGDEPEWIVSGMPGNIPILLRYLQSQDDFAQLGALAEFAAMGAKAKGAVPGIVEALQDPKAFIRIKAAVTLIHMNSQAKAAVAALAKELRSEDASVRAQAAEAIEELVHPQRDFNPVCWGPGPPALVARPWVRKAVDLAIKLDGR